MGNTIGSQRLEDLRSYLLESPDIVVHSLLATYKLFKVFHCAHEGFKHGGVIVKLFIPNESEEDDHTELRIESLLKPYRDATFLVQCRFSGLIHPNVVPYESAEVLHNSGILVRQFFGRNLYDRMYSQPHLTQVHKVWIALQGLCAVAQLHSVGIIHGDIKNENFFLIGSFQSVLTDLSTFIKPVFLPLNDPVAATSLFFESGGSKRRRCFIAPERFIDSLTSRVLDEHGRRMTFFDKEFTQEFVRMDLFSLGLSIAELFLDGQHVIDLPEMLAFRKGGSLSDMADKISNGFIRDLVTSLVQLDPVERPESATACISELLDLLPFAFKGLFIPLLALIGHPVYASADMRMLLFRANWAYISLVCLPPNAGAVSPIDRFTELELFEQCQSTSLLTRGVNASVPPLTAWTSPGEKDLFPHAILNSKNCTSFTQKLVQLWSDGSAVHMRKTGADSWRTAQLPTRINEVYNLLFETHDDGSSEKVDKPDVTMVPLLCSLLGSSALASNATKSKLVYVEMMWEILQTNSPETSSYILPYLHDLVLPAQPTSVREAAMNCLALLVSKLEEAETGLFSEYLFPLCFTAGTDPRSIVNLAVALTESALRLLSAENNDKKIVAIRFFAKKIIEKTAYLANLELVTFLDPHTASTLLVRLVTERADSEEFCMHAPTFCKLVNRESNQPVLSASTIEGIIVPLLLENKSAICWAIRALGQLAITASKATLALIVERVLAETKSSSWIVRECAEHTLVNVIGRGISIVDQFVFLRNILPNRALLDLSKGPNCETSVGPAVSEMTLDDLGNSVTLQIVNSAFPTPPTQSRQFPLRLANYKDFRLETTGLPRAPMTEMGSLYSEEDSNSCSLQRQFLNTLPCVPVQHCGNTKVPQSLLLSTLMDFCASGLAVPVVAIDCTDEGRVLIGAGADCSLRIWRASALESDSLISASRTVVAPTPRLFTVRAVRNNKALAVIGSDEQLMLFRMDGEGGFLNRSESHTFGCPIKLECFDTDFTSCVFAACDKGGAVNWDFRTNHFALKLDKLGPLSGLVLSKDAHKFALSTYIGQLMVYDQRFLRTPVHNWTHSNGPISGLAHSGSKDSFSAWVSTTNEVCLFDLEKGNLADKILSTIGPNGLVGDAPRLNKTPAVFDPSAVGQLIRSDATARALLECSTPNDWTVFTGHNDGVVRYWQAGNAGVAFPGQIEPSATVYKPNHAIQPIIKEPNSHPFDDTTYPSCTVTEGHRDAINDICVASLQADIIVTAGRDGLVKLWK